MQRELGDLLQVKRHPQVILGRMQPHPGHRVFARDIIGVVGLMLMPEERQGNGCHHSPFKTKGVVVARPVAVATAAWLGPPASGRRYRHGPDSPPDRSASDPQTLG